MPPKVETERDSRNTATTMAAILVCGFALCDCRYLVIAILNHFCIDARKRKVARNGWLVSLSVLLIDFRSSGRKQMCDKLIRSIATIFVDMGGQFEQLSDLNSLLCVFERNALSTVRTPHLSMVH